MPWDKSILGLANEIRAAFDQELQALALYALGRFQTISPVGNPSLWKNPNAAPKGYVGGSLRQSFTMEKKPFGWSVFTTLPYGERIFVDGWSTQLPAGGIDLIIADLTNRP